MNTHLINNESFCNMNCSQSNFLSCPPRYESSPIMSLTIETFPDMIINASSFAITNDGAGCGIDIAGTSNESSRLGRFTLTGLLLSQIDANTYTIQGSLSNNAVSSSPEFLFSFNGTITINSESDFCLEGTTTNANTVGYKIMLCTMNSNFVPLQRSFTNSMTCTNCPTSNQTILLPDSFTCPPLYMTTPSFTISIETYPTFTVDTAQFIIFNMPQCGMGIVGVSDFSGKLGKFQFGGDFQTQTGNTTYTIKGSFVNISTDSSPQFYFGYMGTADIRSGTDITFTGVTTQATHAGPAGLTISIRTTS